MSVPSVRKFSHGTPMYRMASAPDVREYDTAGGAGTGTISVASVNLLAPLYVRPVDARTGQVQPYASFDWISEVDSDRILGEEHRLPRLLRCVRACGCDFVCVQELQLERIGGGAEASHDDVVLASQLTPFVLPKWISPLVDGHGSCSAVPRFGVIYPNQVQLEKIAERNRRVLHADTAITTAVFYRSDRWRPIASGSVGECDNNTTTCVTQAFLSVVDGEDSGPVVISSIHLDACSEEKRVQQLQRCLERSISFSTSPYTPPCIVAGDYNCELNEGSCVGAFLTEGGSELNNTVGSGLPTMVSEKLCLENRMNECAGALRLPKGVIPSEDQLMRWNTLHESVEKFIQDHLLMLRRIDSGCTRAAYDHDENPSVCTNESGRMAQWKLDHIVFTPATLVPLGRWSTLEDDKYSSEVGLPNDKIPTDHLPIAALFARRPHRSLDKETAAALLEEVNSMEKRHQSALLVTNAKFEQERMELEQRLAIKCEEGAGATNQSLPAQKFKKKTKSPPPLEIVNHIRSNRAAIKQLKAEQRKERQKFINEKTALEMMVLQHSLSATFLGERLSCADWIESGTTKKR